FDGDARKDILAVGAAQLSIQYVDTSGALAGSFAMPTTNLFPPIGDLSADGMDDIAFPLVGNGSADLGTAVMLGRSDRTLGAGAYPTLAFPAGSHAVFISVISQRAYPWFQGADPYVLADNGGPIIAIARASTAGSGAPVPVLPFPGKQ